MRNVVVPKPWSGLDSDALAFYSVVSMRATRVLGELVGGLWHVVVAESPHYQPAFIVYAVARDAGYTGFNEDSSIVNLAVAATLSRWSAMVIDDVLDEDAEKGGKPTLYGLIGKHALQVGLALLTYSLMLKPGFTVMWYPFVRGWMHEYDVNYLSAVIVKTAFPNVYTALLTLRKLGLPLNNDYARSVLRFWLVVGLVQQLYDDIVDKDVPAEKLAPVATALRNILREHTVPGDTHLHYWRTEIDYKLERIKEEGWLG